MDTAFQTDAFQGDPLAWQMNLGPVLPPFRLVPMTGREDRIKSLVGRNDSSMDLTGRPPKDPMTGN